MLIKKLVEDKKEVEKNILTSSMYWINYLPSNPQACRIKSMRRKSLSSSRVKADR